MSRRTLGSTPLRVTPIGLGLAALGRPGYITLGRDEDLGPDRSVAALERRCHEVLSEAYDAGVRYFDVARSYGLAERFLASWFDRHSLQVDEVTVGSKWGYTYVGDWRVDARVHELKDHSLAALRRQIAESRAELGQRLALYQVHSATLESGVLEDKSVLSELMHLRQDGLVIGLTVSGPAQAATVTRALGIDVDGVNPFESVQATWNLLEPSVGAALAEAHAAGWGVIIKEALANGRLTPRNRAPEMGALHELAEANGTTIDALAMAAVLANPWVDVVLSGAATVGQLDSNLQALGVKPSPDNLGRLAALAEPANRYWSERSSLAWR